ncbi:hypothetical protein D6779_00735 [Candidatus Parcubacteria bacterium]|nr:MAG: hypothetical protein D6779_00735 [Candidatus Parcubacteria bacterium]
MEGKRVGRPRRTRLDVIRAKAWAREVERDTGKSMYKLAMEKDLHDGHLYMIRKGQVSPESFLYISKSAKTVFKVGPYGVPVWHCVAGKSLQIDLDNKELSPVIVAMITDARLPADAINHPLADALSRLPARESKIQLTWIDFCRLAWLYQGLLSDLRQVKNVGIIEVVIFRIQHRLMNSGKFEPHECGYPSPPTKDFDGPIPSYNDPESARDQLIEILITFFSLEARKALEKVHCESFGFTSDELIDAAIEAMKQQNQ